MPMNNNPLFPSSDNAAPTDSSYVLPKQQHSVIQPASAQAEPQGTNEAIQLIREKLSRIYAEEPDPFVTEREAQVVKPRSKHQQFMYNLSMSGRSLADIQTAWHDYYVALPDNEKHEVWQEFYEANHIREEQRNYHPTPKSLPQPGRWPTQPLPPKTVPAMTSIPVPPAPPSQSLVVASPAPAVMPADGSTVAQLRQLIRDKVSAGGKLHARHHLQSLAFGLAIGCVTVVIFLFGFFNEVIIAPFIQPSRTASATPIIVDPSAVATSSTPEIIIPKINLEIPIDYSQTSTNENVIENALEQGIVHYPTTVLPGQTGNAAFFGHSSNNIFNPGKYKFAFVLLHELVPGDTFYITFSGKVYIYKVFSSQIVDPSDVGVLNNVPDHPATATLITCDPPGTSLHRLVVVGDQISPDPTSDNGGTNTSRAVVSSQLPGNGPSLWSRIWNAIF